MSSFQPLVFSGVQPTGNLHLGNYLGAIKKFVALQDTSDCIYCVVDLHSLTAQLVHDDLPEQTRSITAAFLASGIDPAKHIVFNQSRVMQHAELAWIFNCVARIGWMNRMTQFKDKAGKDRENASLGLLAYPSLMAADILVYRATHVPVGDDQKQHLELTRDIAQRFNSLYGETFIVPATKLPTVGGAARVMGLDDPEKKMSKSATGTGHAIGLLDDLAQAKKKIMRATTDSNPAVDFETMGPGVRNLLGIYQAFSNASNDQMQAEFAGLRYGDLKKKVAEMVAQSLEPIQARYREVMADPGYLDGILAEGTARIQPIANQTVRLTKQRMGVYTT